MMVPSKCLHQNLYIVFSASYIFHFVHIFVCFCEKLSLIAAHFPVEEILHG